jgi:ribose transport system ATP-binding protein
VTLAVDRPVPLLAMSGISKHFGGEHALAGIDFELMPGEIHALLGENGAGKSTLIKILAGVVPRDVGEILVGDDALAASHSPADVKAAGVAFVHQDLGLAEHLSVAENIALSVGYATRHGLISFRRTRDQVGEILKKLGVDIDPDAAVAALSQDEKVMVAVARNLTYAKASGTGYVYVTHRLDEVFSFADRLTVLRDGKHVKTVAVRDSSYEQVVGWITGAAVVESLPERLEQKDGDEDVRLRVSGLLGSGLAEPINFSVRRGEVVALCGLVGCGAREVAAMLGGADRPRAGGATLDGAPLPLGAPRKLRAAGCTYVPGDRQAEGGVLGMSVRENLFLTRAGGGESVFRDPRPERRSAVSLAKRFDVRPRERVDRPLSSLSGGNQQKVVAGRALRKGPKLLVLDDPTAGVDVGSRSQLHAILRDTAAAGTSVVFASTDFEEVASEADRALVLWNGRVHTELKGNGLTPERLSQACYGTAQVARGDIS